jgi:hypothetical protein
MAKGGVILPILSEFKPEGVDKAIREFQKLETSTQKVGFGLEKAFLPAAAALGGLVIASVDFAKAAADDQAAADKLAGSLQRVTGATDDQIAAVESFIGKMELATNIADNDLREAFSKLTVATKDTTESQDLLNLSADIAVATGRDLAGVTDAVAKAYSGNMIALQRLDPSLRDAIKSGEDFDEIGKILAETYGGAATRAAETAEGRFQNLGVQLGNLQEQIGYVLLPFVSNLVDILSKMTGFVSDNAGLFTVLAGAVGVVAGAIVAANTAMKVYSGLQAVVKVANTVMGTSFELTAGKMLKFSGILGGVGIAIGLGTVAYNLYRREKERLAGITDDFTRALEAERGGQEGATDAVIVAALASEQMQERIAAAGLTSVDVAKAIRGETTPAFDEFAEKMAFATEKGIAADEQQRRLSDAFGDGGGKARALYFEVDKLRNSYEAADNQVELTESVTKDLQSAQETLADTFRITDDTSKAMADSMAAAEAAMAAYEDQTREANDALQKMIDTSLAMFDADLALEAQLARTEEAIFKYAEQIADGTLKGRDLEAAQRAVKEEALRQADAAVRAAEAQAELAGETLDASDRQKIMVESLAAVADALDPSDPLRKQLVEYIQQLGLIPSVKETVIRTIREDIIQQSIVQATQFSPGAIAAASRTPRVSRNIGGPVPGILNTSTPIMAHGGEYVLSADVVDAIKRGAPSRGLGRGGAAGGGGGNVINITVTSADPQAVIQAIRQYNRTNGPAPIRVAS